MVCGVGQQTKGAMVRREDVANKQETKTLTLWLGGIERREEVGRHIGRDARAVVSDDKC